MKYLITAFLMALLTGCIKKNIGHTQKSYLAGFIVAKKEGVYFGSLEMSGYPARPTEDSIKVYVKNFMDCNNIQYIRNPVIVSIIEMETSEMIKYRSKDVLENCNIYQIYNLEK